MGAGVAAVVLLVGQGKEPELPALVVRPLTVADEEGKVLGTDRQQATGDDVGYPPLEE